MPAARRREPVPCPGRARRGFRRTGTALLRGSTKDNGAVVTGAPADTTTRTSRREAGVEVVEV